MARVLRQGPLPAIVRSELALALVLLAGCGSEAGAGPQLTVTVRPQGPDGPAHAQTLDCAAGDCSRLRALESKALAPVPDDIACNMIYGGPATATVAGRLDGEAVDARFTLRNGCEISRWKRLSWLLGAPPSG